MIGKRAPWLILAILLALLVYFRRELSPGLEWIRSPPPEWRAFLAEHPYSLMAAYFFGYIAYTALALPGAIVLTLGAGAFFGLGYGTLLVSFASAIGASLSFLIARYWLRDAVKARFAARLRAVDAGIARDGPFYLLTLRLLPLVPFLAVNLAMGLTSMPVRQFYAISQVGMLPATLLYVNAGTRIAEIRDPGDILSLPLLLSFAALAVLPWLARAGLNWLKSRRLYGRFTKPRRFDRNLIVVGAGASGLVAAYIAAITRAKVTLVEAGLMGGDCLNYGCVPSKALIRAGRAAHDVAQAGRFGIKARQEGIDFPALMARINAVIGQIAPHDSVERFTGLGVEARQGHARLIDPWTVEITGKDAQPTRLTSKAIVIAAGAAPFVPPIRGLDQVDYLTSDTLWAAFSLMPALPARIAILGGGAIGCELAQALRRLGAEITLIETAERLLIREDADIAGEAAASLEREGVALRLGAEISRIEPNQPGGTIIAKAGGQDFTLAFDALIVATGRQARLTGYGLEELGIPANRVIETNEYLETLYPNIFAAGDVAGPFQLTHAGAHQGWHAAVNALFGRFYRFRVDYSVLPATIFLDPEIARVGLNESEAKKQGIPHEVTRYELAELDRAIADGATHGFVKVLTKPGSARILGVSIVGAHAGEWLAEFALAMRKGLDLNAVLSTIHAYPTFAEANKFAAGNWKRAHAPGRILALMARFHAWERGGT